MDISNIVFYLSLGMGLLVLYMLKPAKPKHPTPLKMKDFSPKKKFRFKQLHGAKPVQAQIMQDDEITAVTEVTNVQGTKWAAPTVFENGKAKDAYAVLKLSPGTPLAQVRAQVAHLLRQKNTASKIDLIKRAYQAIVDAENT